jgi:hypothetical protein
MEQEIGSRHGRAKVRLPEQPWHAAWKTHERMAKLIVRRGMRPEYYGFLTMTAVANGDEVIVDRRRQTASDPADALHPGFPDRRGPRSEKWIDDDVIVVDGPGASPEVFLHGD